MRTRDECNDGMRRGEPDTGRKEEERSKSHVARCWCGDECSARGCLQREGNSGGDGVGGSWPAARTCRVDGKGKCRGKSREVP